MLNSSTRLLCLFAFLAAPLLAGPICATDTLSNYEALGAGGCRIGGLSVINFSFVPTAGNNVTILASDITVNPVVGLGTLGLIFSSTSFHTSGAGSADYLLSYTWDPGDIRSLEDILNASSPVPPGFAQISTSACLDAAFSPTCPTSTANVVVSDNGISLNSPHSVSFSPPVGTLGIVNTITLNANGASSQINNFENRIATPEPSMALPCFLLLAALFSALQRVELRREFTPHFRHWRRF